MARKARLRRRRSRSRGVVRGRVVWVASDPKRDWADAEVELEVALAAELVTEHWEGIHKKSSVVAEPTLDAVAAAIQALDGRVYTMVSIVFKESSVIFIGGGGSNGLYVVTATYDGEHFKIATGDASSTGMVTMIVGGQEGDYPARHCVDFVTALRAARAFASTGEMDSTVNWEDDQ